MSDALHEHARMLARNLLRLQVCTIGEIAETLELEPPEVQQLAVEVYDERAEQLTALRQIMNDIKEKPAGRQQQEALLFDAIGILNQLLHRREPGRGETADIRNWIHNMAACDLLLYLDKLYAGGNDGEILIHGRVLLDSVYALFMRTHYDDLRRHDDDFNEPDTTAAPSAPDAAPDGRFGGHLAGRLGAPGRMRAARGLETRIKWAFLKFLPSCPAAQTEILYI